jgi:alkanesulfonate monooxygenase SsuD/methylene tetrahydromethanopterin reductase-like flavin-dependent oxidoreductase (luciferase family)
MKLGIVAGYSPATMSIPMDLIHNAEDLGFSSVWTAEAWGSDAVSPAAWILAQTTKINVGTAIMQMPGRTPAMTAMTAMTLYSLSGGRFILGLGPSGPQVVEGWHGVAYGRPLTRTKEYISIIRTILERKERLEHDGFHYQIQRYGMRWRSRRRCLPGLDEPREVRPLRGVPRDGFLEGRRRQVSCGLRCRALRHGDHGG